MWQMYPVSQLRIFSYNFSQSMNQVIRLFAIKHERIHSSITKLKGKFSAQGLTLMATVTPITLQSLPMQLGDLHCYRNSSPQTSSDQDYIFFPRPFSAANLVSDYQCLWKTFSSSPRPQGQTSNESNQVMLLANLNQKQSRY